MKAVIFLGPTLPLLEAREILDAVYLPPARQTDFVTALVNHRPDVIGLIDGEFHQTLSVWHKEILYALDRGIRVYGSSSMGALRAAETAAYGMIGVGEIYRQYASGELMDDDEVALSHATSEQGYLKTSEPMVNLRATFAAARAAGVIDAGEVSRLLIIAKRIYFAERSFPAIFHAAKAEGMALDALERMFRFSHESYVDLKREDAIELLNIVKHLPAHDDGATANHRSFSFMRSPFFETLYHRDRRIERGDVALPLESISNFVALNHPAFDSLNFNALNRAVVQAFASLLGLQVEAKEIDTECDRFRRKWDVVEEEPFSRWLAANHVDGEEFRDLMTQAAYCRRLHRWFMTAMWMDRSAKIVLDELRLTGSFETWADRAAAQERLLLQTGAGSAHSDSTQLPLQAILDEQQKWTGCRVDIDAASWSAEAGFHSEANLRMELDRATTARRALLQLLMTSPPAAVDAQLASRG